MELSENERQFIEAVINDEAFEYPLDDAEEYILLTDWEGEGEFKPSITIMHAVQNEQAEQHRIDDLLSELDWLRFEAVTIQEDEHVSHAYLEFAEVSEEARAAVKNGQ